MDNKKELEQIFNLIEGLYSHTTEQFTELQSDIADMKVEIADIKVEIADIKTEIADIKTEIGEMKAEIGEMKAEIGEIKVEITSNREATERLEQEVRKINKTISNHDLDINLLKKVVV
jgi:uncharacterized coiled-coil DUF342 family protein